MFQNKGNGELVVTPENPIRSEVFTLHFIKSTPGEDVTVDKIVVKACVHGELSMYLILPLSKITN